MQGQHAEQVQEIVLTLPGHLLRLRPDGQHFRCLAIGSHDTSLTLAREAMRQAIDPLRNK